MKHISVHLQRKSHFLKSSTFLNIQCPKQNIPNAIFTQFKFCSSSPITNMETMWGDFLWYVLLNQWCVHRKFLPRISQNTNTNVVSYVSLCLCATNALIDFTCGFDNFWFMIIFSPFWRFWWDITGSKHIKDHSSGAVWESRWTSWAVHPNEPSGFRGRKDLLNCASALVTTCP